MIEKLDQIIKQKHMLKTPFYQAWSRGELSRETLREYAKQYYHHVKAFPTYLSALHSRSEDAQVRKHLLENLIDEEAGTPNHPELWRSFALGLGVTEEELDSPPGPAVQKLVQAFRKICGQDPVAAGIAALYCYESQIPVICSTKIAGLKSWYGMKNPDHYHYFTVHETADVVHSQVERELLLSIVSPQEEQKVLEISKHIVQELWDFLESFHVKCEKSVA